jgi:hypothetical protein
MILGKDTGATRPAKQLSQQLLPSLPAGPRRMTRKAVSLFITDIVAARSAR